MIWWKPDFQSWKQKREKKLSEKDGKINGM